MSFPKRSPAWIWPIQRRSNPIRIAYSTAVTCAVSALHGVVSQTLELVSGLAFSDLIQSPSRGVVRVSLMTLGRAEIIGGSDWWLYYRFKGRR